MPASKRGLKKSRRKGSDGDDDLVAPKKVTGKELDATEELSTRLTALVEMLDERGIISSREYNRIVAMRLHEVSKASAFQELEDEL
ncbi:MAG TPA: hypothetical protein VFA15_01290 [Nitrososphaera sp.]|nr:hypothetical protein [Nitrososphaera sp.]